MWTAKKRGILKLENSTANRSEHASAGMHAQTDGPESVTLPVPSTGREDA